MANAHLATDEPLATNGLACGDVRPLTKREMNVYNCLLRDFMDSAEQLAAYLRAMQIIAGMEDTGVPVDERLRHDDETEVAIHNGGSRC